MLIHRSFNLSTGIIFSNEFSSLEECEIVLILQAKGGLAVKKIKNNIDNKLEESGDIYEDVEEKLCGDRREYRLMISKPDPVQCGKRAGRW